MLSVFSILPERVSGYQVPFIHDGKDPPSYDITRAQLELLVGSGFTSRQIAEILGVLQSTVRRRLRQGLANLKCLIHICACHKITVNFHVSTGVKTEVMASKFLKLKSSCHMFSSQQVAVRKL